MRSLILFFIRSTRQANSTNKFGSLARIINFIFILFSCSFVFAQHISEKESVQYRFIYLQSRAQIYSADDAFNQQIKQGNIVISKSQIIITQVLEKKHLVIAPKKAVNVSRSLSLQLKNAETEKKENLIKKIQKQITEHRKRTESFITDDFKSYPSSDHFSTTQGGNKSYISQRTDSQDFSKIYFDESHYSVKRALDDLQSQKFNYYNNKSLDYCFSQVFSTRPPPSVLVSISFFNFYYYISHIT